MATGTPHEPDTFQPEPDTLLVEDRSLVGGFIQLPRLVLRARNLSRDAKLLYAILLSYAWQEQRCFPGYRRLCEDLDASENAVRKYMRELEACDLLRQKRRGLGKTNIYTLCDLRTAKIEVLEPQKRESASRTSKNEVQEPTKSAGPEPAKSEVYLETVELEAEDRTLSKFRVDPLALFLVPDTEEKPTKNNETIIVAMDDNASPEKSADQQSPAQGLADTSTRERLLIFVQDFGREFNDSASVRSSTTRMANIYRKSSLPLDEFIAHLYQARETTRERTAAIRASAGDPDARWKKNKMGYFFTVLQNQLRMPE